MVETRNPTIERAIEIITEEIELTEDERRAFRRFLSQLRDVEPSEKRPAAESPLTHEPAVAIADSYQLGGDSRGASATRRVIDAYRETIVQLAHFEEKYGNLIHEDIALEFGEQAAYTLFATAELSPIAFRHLVTQAEESLENRVQYARELDRELNSLEHYDAELSEVETRFAECPAPPEVAAETVPAVRDELLGLEQRCEELINRRQERLHSRSSASLRGVDNLSFNRYAYGQHLSINCPVLYDALFLLRNIRAQRECCEETLAPSTMRVTN